MGRIETEGSQMSKVSINDPLLLERQEQENAMYHRIMQDGAGWTGTVI